MLRAAVADFAALDGCDVITTRDPRLPGELGARWVRTVSPGTFDEAFDECLAACDAALVVAPEQGGLLAGLIERVERAGVLHLGSRSDAVRIAGDKLATLRRLAQAGLPVPVTVEAPAPEAAGAVGFPLVLKPRDGAGCVGLRRVDDPADLARAWAEARAAANGSPLIAQPYVRGTHASASLLCGGVEPQPVSLNGQAIVEDGRFEYCGGIVPLEHPLAARALGVAGRACALVPGLFGYVGVDLVLASDAVVMEINPRLTTAYTGLRRAAGANLAAAILDAARGAPPRPVPLVVRARFTAGGEVEVEPLHRVGG